VVGGFVRKRGTIVAFVLLCREELGDIPSSSFLDEVEPGVFTVF
jgi:hypothetical protein